MLLEEFILLEKINRMKSLKANKVALTDKERQMVMDSKAVWQHGPKGTASPAVWKSVCPKSGDVTYVTNTHRSFATASTCAGAIKKYHSSVRGTA